MKDFRTPFSVLLRLSLPFEIEIAEPGVSPLQPNHEVEPESTIVVINLQDFPDDKAQSNLLLVADVVAVASYNGGRVCHGAVSTVQDSGCDQQAGGMYLPEIF